MASKQGYIYSPVGRAKGPRRSSCLLDCLGHGRKDSTAAELPHWMQAHDITWWQPSASAGEAMCTCHNHWLTFSSMTSIM